jgi:hypothetical protein
MNVTKKVEKSGAWGRLSLDANRLNSDSFHPGAAGHGRLDACPEK